MIKSKAMTCCYMSNVVKEFQNWLNGACVASPEITGQKNKNRIEEKQLN